MTLQEFQENKNMNETWKNVLSVPVATCIKRFLAFDMHHVDSVLWET